MFTVILVLFAACGGGSADIELDTVRLDIPFTLKPGQSATLEDGTAEIEFSAVLEDSRCPANAECVIAGSVRVEVLINGKAHTLTLGDLMSDDTSSTGLDNGMMLELLEVNPYPGSEEDTPNEVDSITLVVRK
jgi:hypothetical protein